MYNIVRRFSGVMSERESSLWRIYKNAVFLPDDEFNVLCKILREDNVGDLCIENFINLFNIKRVKLPQYISGL